MMTQSVFRKLENHSTCLIFVAQLETSSPFSTNLFLQNWWCETSKKTARIDDEDDGADGTDDIRLVHLMFNYNIIMIIFWRRWSLIQWRWSHRLAHLQHSAHQRLDVIAARLEVFPGLRKKGIVKFSQVQKILEKTSILRFERGSAGQSCRVWNLLPLRAPCIRMSFFSFHIQLAES